jgi:hypothetical protein
MKMRQQVFPSESNPKILIKVHGNFSIQGWDRQQLEVESDPDEESDISQEGNTFTVNCDSDCYLMVPRTAQLSVDYVDGDGKVQGLEESIVIKRVSGNLHIRDTVKAHIEHVSGDLALERIQGELQILHVSGNLKADEVNGDVKLDTVSGDVAIKQVQGSLTARRVSGELIGTIIYGQVNVGGLVVM